MKAKVTTKSRKSSAVRELALLISVPLLLAGLLAAVVYIPQAIANPTTDFVYSSCETYNCPGVYKVNDGVIVAPSNQDIKPDPALSPELGYVDAGKARLYYYDISESSSKPLSDEGAKQLKLDDSSRSKDGYQLINESGAGGSIFGDGYDSNWVLQDVIYRKKVDLVEGEPWSNSIRFVGWVK